MLAELLEAVRFRPGWSFALITYGSETNLAVELETVDTYHPERPARVGHKIPLPPLEHLGRADRAWWRRWLLDRIADVDRHEACEWFLERVDAPAPPISAQGDCDPTAVMPREEWVRPFDPHADPLQPAYVVRDRLADASSR